METLGIESLKKSIDLVLTVESIVGQAKKDGKIDTADLGLLLGIIPVIGPAVEGFKGVLPELKDLSEAEGLELTAYIVTKLTVDDVKAKLIVEKSLKLLVAGYELQKAITFEPAVQPAV